MRKVRKATHRNLLGDATVIPELRKDKLSKTLKSYRNKKFRMIQVVTALLLTSYGTSTYAQELVYDGTTDPGTVPLVSENSLNLPAWMDLNSGDLGVVYGSSTATDADLVINYDTGAVPSPKFVIGGLAEDGTEVKQNMVTIRQGEVAGPVYGGLSHQTEITPDQDKSGDPPTSYNSAGTSASLVDGVVNASQNTVNAEDGQSVIGDLYGGNATIWVQAGEAIAGNASISAESGASVSAENSNATASNNTIMVADSGLVQGSIYGGYSSVVARAGIATAGDVSLSANGNIIITANAVINIDASDSIVVANNNTVTVGENTTVTSSLYGGSANVILQAGNTTGGNADAENTLTGMATASSVASSNLYAFSLQLTASENKLTVENGVSITGSLYGGAANLDTQTGNGEAGDAKVISLGNGNNNANANASATFVDDVSLSSVVSSKNAVTVGMGAVVDGSIYGGYANFVVKAEDATAGEAVARNNANAYAAATSRADTSSSTVTVNENRVTLGTGGSISESIYGGYVSLFVQSGDDTAGNADATRIANAFARSYAESSSSASGSTLTVSDNIVEVGENVLVSGSLSGGYAKVVTRAGDATAGEAIATSSPNSFPTATATASTEFSSSVVAVNNNKVIVGDGSTVGGDLSGGYVSLTGAAGTATAGMANGNLATATATVDVSDTQVLANNNEVTMHGALTGGSLYGGSVLFNITPGTIVGNGTSSNAINLTGSMAQAIENTITLGANAQINSPSGSLYGGYLEYNPGFAPESYDVFSGNTLNFSAKTPALVQNVGNFEYYNFAINPIYANTNTALISAEDISLGANTDNMDSSSQNGQTSKIKVVGIHSGNVLNAGDTFILMSASQDLTGDGSGETSRDVAQQGISLLYDVETAVDSANKKVTATILGNNGPLVNPQLKSLAEGYLLGSQLVTRGADLIADDAYRAIQEQNPQGGWSPFVILSGQHNRYNSGSHIKSNDFLMAGGLSYQQKNWTAGAFLEGGWGSYDSYNSFSQVSDVHGTGNDRYYGLGLLGRYQFTSGFYSDASIRFGRNRTKFDTNDIQNFATGEFAHYNLTSNYLSGHVGVGYRVPLTDKNELDISAKYLYTTLSGKNATIAGDRIDFDRVDSNRIRLGIQLNHQYSKTVTLHSGLAYEYEFDGKAGANTYGISIGDAPSLKGSTGILSIGALVKARPNLNFDLKLNGYTGKREGFGANVKMTYLF